MIWCALLVLAVEPTQPIESAKGGPAEAVALEPSLRMDRKNKEVTIEAEVVLREGRWNSFFVRFEPRSMSRSWRRISRRVDFS